jgi:cell division ATPase FtsA
MDTQIHITKEPSDTHIKILKEEILEEITEKLMENILDMVTRMYKMHSRNFKTSK